MRIAMFTNNYKPYTGGVPVSIERLSMGLRRQGHEVYIFAPSYGDKSVDNDTEDGYVIRYASYKKRLDGGFVIPKSSDPLIKKELKRINPDIIHTHHPMLIGSRAVELGARYSIPVVYTYHTRYEDYLHYISLYRKIEELGEKGSGIAGKAAEKIDILSKRKLLTAYMRGFIKKCDLVFSPSLLTERIVDELKTGVPQVRLATGIEDRFYCGEKNIELRSKLAGGKSLVLCTVTRLSKEKNIEFILKSLRVFKERFGDDFKYVLIGDGPARNELETMAHNLGIADNVHFAGNINNSEVHKYYSACDIFLFASKSETQGIVLLEAMASSMPVVAVNAGGVEDVVRNGKNGFMTPENERDFANKLYITAANNMMDGRYSRGARETADMYTVNKMAQKAQEGYLSAILENQAKMGVARRHTA